MKMNATSSRSHTLLKLVIETKGAMQDTAATMAELFLVDLAGSERVAKAGTTGVQVCCSQLYYTVYIYALYDHIYTFIHLLYTFVHLIYTHTYT